MSEMRAAEGYVVAAGGDGSSADGSVVGEAAIRMLAVFSSLDAARRLTRTGGQRIAAEPKKIDASELRHLLDRARSEGCTHVALDGRPMRIDGFEVLLDHERLE